jgi:antirestriction protein ArdC
VCFGVQELVAELGAAFLCADLELTPAHLHHHASYISHCIKRLGGSTHVIFTAAAHAQRAVDFLHSLQKPRG